MDRGAWQVTVNGDSPGKNTGVDCHALLQGIFPTQGSNPGLPHRRQILYNLSHQGSPPGSLEVKNLPAMQETPVRFLGWEDALEKEMQPTLVLLHGESHGRRSLVGYSPWGRKELDTTEQLHFQGPSLKPFF